jgi:hypothetical protein
MRFMMIMYPGPKAEIPGNMPDEKGIAAMMKYNEDLTKSGALLSLDGLHPTSAGARVRYQAGKAVVTDGPFTEAKEVVGGFWMIQVKSKEEAVQWAKKIPADDGQMVELRRVFEMADFNIDPAGPINDQVGRVEAGLKANQGRT